MVAAAEAQLVPASRTGLRGAVRRIWADAERADPEMLLWTGSLWGRWAVRERRWRDAAAGYRIAVETLHELARRQADREHGDRWLRSGGQLAGEAAYAGAAAGDPRQAVQLMETGRLVLLTDTLIMRAFSSGGRESGLPIQLTARLNAAVRRLRAAEQAALLPAMRR
jgi:hypothetical protein